MSIEWPKHTWGEEDIPENQENTDPKIIEGRKTRLRERRKKDLFAILSEDVWLAMEEQERMEKSGTWKGADHDAKFYFKKAWDDFTAPLFIYDELRKQQEIAKKDIENRFAAGTLSNTKRKGELKNIEEGIKNLEERKRESEDILAKTAPEGFNEKTEKQKRAWLDRLYESYVSRLRKGK